MSTRLFVIVLLAVVVSTASGQSPVPTFEFRPADSVAVQLEEIWRNPKVGFVCLYGERNDTVLAVSRVHAPSRNPFAHPCRGAVSFASFRRNDETTTEAKMRRYMKDLDIPVAILVVDKGRGYKVLFRQE